VVLGRGRPGHGRIRGRPGCSYRILFTTIVAANVPGNISGLRITGRFTRVTYTNNSGGVALVEFGVYVRSS
jgi:hypothetical protein